MISEAEEDLLLSACYILVLAGAAVVPVVHLLCDDVICGAGVDLFRCHSGVVGSLRSNSDAEKIGSENEAFAKRDNPDDV